MRKIDVENWDRKDIFNFYKDMDFPMYSMTFELDVTRFYSEVKKAKQSFYFTFMYHAMYHMNQIENFKYRFMDQEPYICETIHPSFTDLIQGKNLFKIVTIDFLYDEKKFIENARMTSDLQKDQFIDLTKESRNNLVYITTFPWASYTHVSFAHNQDAKDAVPRLTWGKFEDINGKKMMPFTLAVHHAFVDGYHVGQLINNLQNALNNYTAKA